MGFFDKFKKAPEAVYVTIGQLPALYEQASQDKLLSVRSKVEEELAELRYHLRKAKEFLNTLQKEDPLPFPSEVEKRKLKRAKERLAEDLAAVLKSIRTDRGVVELYRSAKYFHDHYQELEDAMQPDLFLAKDFHEKTVGHLRRKLEQIDKAMVDIFNILETQEVKDVIAIQDMLDHLVSNKERLQGIKKEQKELDAERSALQEKANTIRKRIAKLKETRDYELFGELRKKQEALPNKISELLQPLRQAFLDLETVLQKFEKQTGKKRILSQYRKDLKTAILKDKKHALANTLSKLQESLEQQKIKLGKASKEKALAIIQQLDKAFLEETRKRLHLLLEEEEEVKLILKKNTAILNVKEQEGWLKTSIRKINEATQAWQALENEIERMNLSLQEQRIAQSIGRLVDKVYRIRR